MPHPSDHMQALMLDLRNKNLIGVHTYHALQAEAIKQDDLLKQAVGRVFDLLLNDDGQAYKEARKFLETHFPAVATKLDKRG